MGRGSKGTARAYLALSPSFLSDNCFPYPRAHLSLCIHRKVGSKFPHLDNCFSRLYDLGMPSRLVA